MAEEIHVMRAPHLTLTGDDWMDHAIELMK
jgi:hypothetical protein